MPRRGFSDAEGQHVGSALRRSASVINLAEQRLCGSIEFLHGILDDALTLDVGDQFISASQEPLKQRR
jgi:hypothetical protein